MSERTSIRINGQTCEAAIGANLADVIKEQHIFLPSLCYYPHIDPPLGTCRVCTVHINGKPIAACTVKVKPGMEVETDTPDLADTRRGMVEMLFAEGNHFCPSCEKSGDCDLQGLGYRLGITVSRFPHLFVDRITDYRPQRMVIEHNRCIRCRRCVEEVSTDDGKHVFSFVNRGNETEVAIDYEQEARLSEAQARRAMHICPTGAILVRGDSLARPRGERKYDEQAESFSLPAPPRLTPSGRKGKKVIATTSLAGCFGCHMSMLDIDTDLLDLIELVEFNRSPLTDIKTFSKRCDIGIIEGGCSNSDNVEVLRAFRENCDILIAVGECAIWGGLPAMRNMVPLEECLLEAYSRTTDKAKGLVVPSHEELPELLDRVYACNEIVKVDYYIPGCPPDASHIWKILRYLVLEEPYTVTQAEFKYD